MGVVAALLSIAAIGVLPQLVDVGFLGWMAFPVWLRLALHLPLLVTATAAMLALLMVVGAARHWWTTRIRARDAALLGALAALATQLAYWYLVAWGF